MALTSFDGTVFGADARAASMWPSRAAQQRRHPAHNRGSRAFRRAGAFGSGGVGMRFSSSSTLATSLSTMACMSFSSGELLRRQRHTADLNPSEVANVFSPAGSAVAGTQGRRALSPEAAAAPLVFRLSSAAAGAGAPSGSVKEVSSSTFSPGRRDRLSRHPESDCHPHPALHSCRSRHA